MLYFHQKVKNLKAAQFLIKELTFIANIQVYYAEFPYLHYSITPCAFNTGDLLQLWERFVVRKIFKVYPILQNKVYTLVITQDDLTQG
jgi:hypothetical protein